VERRQIAGRCRSDEDSDATAETLERAWRRFSFASASKRRRFMTLGTILIILLILALIGAIPNWGYSRGWGYGPSGIVGVILVVVVVLALLGRV
jgi:sterol desaturase/sphingolipid hydroxylase (fatty acid hydroxylase superfamily)